jgi:hypothetical protein
VIPTDGPGGRHAGHHDGRPDGHRVEALRYGRHLNDFLPPANQPVAAPRGGMRPSATHSIGSPRPGVNPSGLLRHATHPVAAPPHVLRDDHLWCHLGTRPHHPSMTTRPRHPEMRTRETNQRRDGESGQTA